MSKTTLRYTIDNTDHAITGQSYPEVYRMFGDILMQHGIPIPDGSLAGRDLDVLIAQAGYEDRISFSTGNPLIAIRDGHIVG